MFFLEVFLKALEGVSEEYFLFFLLVMMMFAMVVLIAFLIIVIVSHIGHSGLEGNLSFLDVLTLEVTGVFIIEVNVFGMIVVIGEDDR